jgi:hypothetical protein
MNIHEYTIDRLNHIKADPAILADRKLLLLFVDLERARQSVSLDLWESAISRIRAYLRRHNREHLLVYGYQYIAFMHDKTRREYSIEKGDDGSWKHVFKYSRKVSRDEHALLEWAWMKYQQHAKFRSSRGRNSRKPAGAS